MVAVLALGAGPGEIGTLAAVQTLPFLSCRFRWGCSPTASRGGG